MSKELIDIDNLPEEELIQYKKNYLQNIKNRGREFLPAFATYVERKKEERNLIKGMTDEEYLRHIGLPVGGYRKQTKNRTKKQKYRRSKTKKGKGNTRRKSRRS
jgi:hypothetical protein